MCKRSYYRVHWTRSREMDRVWSPFLGGWKESLCRCLFLCLTWGWFCQSSTSNQRKNFCCTDSVELWLILKDELLTTPKCWPLPVFCFSTYTSTWCCIGSGSSVTCLWVPFSLMKPAAQSRSIRDLPYRWAGGAPIVCLANIGHLWHTCIWIRTTKNVLPCIICGCVRGCEEHAWHLASQLQATGVNVSVDRLNEAML